MEANMQILCTAARNLLLSLGTTLIYLKAYVPSVPCEWHMLKLELQTYFHTRSLLSYTFLRKRSL